MSAVSGELLGGSGIDDFWWRTRPYPWSFLSVAMILNSSCICLLVPRANFSLNTFLGWIIPLIDSFGKIPALIYHLVGQ